MQSILVDQRNFKVMGPYLADLMKNAPYTGVDIETHNGNAHAGIKKMNKGKKNIFDIRRTVVTGISFYPENSPAAYYVNLNHRDIQNRVSFEEVRDIMIAPLWIIHNASFEKVMMRATYGYDFTNYIDTLQMAVSAYGPDNYPLEKFLSASLGEMGKFLPDIAKEFDTWDGQSELTPAQAELIGQVCGKSSKAAHSYNGWVENIAFGYGLKKAVKSFFGYEMEHYEDCLKNSEYAKKRAFILSTKDKRYAKYKPYFEEEPHMGHLTGEEVVSYGADDSYWCVQLFKKLTEFMEQNCPSALPAFFAQENRMVDIFSNIQIDGIRINREAILKKRDEERLNVARTFREIKRIFRELLPFPALPNQAMIKAEPWYAKNWQKYRQQIIDFANSPDYDDSPEGVMQQLIQTNGGTSASYAEDIDLKKNRGIINLAHYMPIRTIFYDLLGHKILKVKGKVSSGKDIKGKMKESYDKESLESKLIDCLNKISQVDQVCKLYLNPYLNMIDPETGKIYPSISSELATRRMSMSNPNGQQLAKRGESVYVRGFYLPDSPDHVIMSSDWNSVELVIPGELSKDPEFVRCFSKVPYDDLHSIAAAAMLDMSEEDFNMLKHLPESQTELHGIPFINTKGEQLTPAKFRKWARTELGKGANFSYAFSGALSTLQEKLGWDDQTHWDKVDAYRQRFPVFEQWRLDTIAFACENGYIDLPDGHRRFRLEATQMWADVMQQKFLRQLDLPGVRNFLRKFIKLIQTRAKNQSVNSKVQGTAAALAKRSMYNLEQAIRAKWPKSMCRIMLPIHDEIVTSVHKDIVLEYNQLVRQVMNDHPWLMKTCRLNCSVSMGRTFEPFDQAKAPYGQIELDEAPEVDWLPKEAWGNKLSDELILKVLDYQFNIK